MPAPACLRIVRENSCSRLLYKLQQQDAYQHSCVTSLREVNCPSSVIQHAADDAQIAIQVQLQNNLPHIYRQLLAFRGVPWPSAGKGS